MEIISDSAFQILPFAGRINFPKHSLTILIKATFDISHGSIAKIAGDQIPASADEYYPDDKTQSGTLYYPSDFAYFKPAADVLLSAKCHTPNAEMLPACPVSMTVGGFKKTLFVYGSRHWKKVYFSPTTTEPKLFNEMDLIYERSFGGKDYALNPIGRGVAKDDISIADNVLPVPNIQDPNHPVKSPFSKTFPVGFSPLQSHWLQRHEKRGTYDKKYLKNRWPWFPEDFDWYHFNAAPRDQQIKGYLRGDEKLVFENLHRQFALYKTQLPCIRPRCFARKQDAKTGKRYFDEIQLHLDTLWVDLETEKLVLTWRGWTDVIDEDFEEVKQIFMMEESMHEQYASIEACYAAFKAAQDAEDAEFSGKPKIPKMLKKQKNKLKPAKVPSAAVLAASVVAPSLSAEETLDKPAILSQIDQLMKEAGIDVESLPPKVKEKILTTQNKMFSTPSEKVAENESQLAEIMQEMGVDVNSLPELTPKAKQEQARFFEELGFDSAETEITPEIDKTWALLVASLPKMGMSAEDLSPLMSQNKVQMKLLKERLNPELPVKAEPAQTEFPEGEAAKKSKSTFNKNQSYKDQDLSGENFSGMDLSGCDFSNCILKGADFSHCNLQQAIFKHANLAKANFENANLVSADFSYADVKAAVMNGANCNQCIIDDANFEGIQADSSSWHLAKGKDAIFVRSALNGSDFSEALLENADFESAALNEADFTQSQLVNATFESVTAKKSVFFKANISGLRASQGADFSGSNFSQSSGEFPIFLNVNFEGANLSYANLCGGNFDRANLKMANLCAANLKQSRFIKADLSTCQLIKANLMQSSVERANLFQADLRGANCYEVEFLDAQLDEANFEGANLAGSKLA